MKRTGFTLVEVLVILAILAALAAILVPTVANQEVMRVGGPDWADPVSRS